MLNPLKCIVTAEFSFLKAFFGAGLGQKYEYYSQVWAVTKRFLLILHPVIRDRVKF